MRKSIIAKVVTGALVGVLVSACSAEKDAASVESVEPTPSKASAVWPKLDIEVKSNPAVETKVEEILSTMTIEQKIAQMIQPEIRNITVEDMRKYGFGSYLNGGGAFPNNDKQAPPEDGVALAEKP